MVKRLIYSILFLLVIIPSLAQPNIISNKYQYSIPDYNEMPEMYREVVNEVTSNDIYYDLNPNDIHINETGNYSEIVLDGFYYSRNPGMPMLPIKYFEIPIPSDVKSLKIEIVNPAYTGINVNKKINPFVPKNHEFLDMFPRYEIYDDYFSSPNKITVDFGYRGEQKYALVRYFPFGYDSENNKLNITTNSIIKIEYSAEWYSDSKEVTIARTAVTMEALSGGQAPEVEWQKTFGGSSYDSGYSGQQTSDGGYIIAGITTSLGDDSGDVYLIKTYPNGSKQWEKTFGENSSQDLAYSVQQTSDGGYIITGQSHSVENGSLYLIKTYPNGTLQWEKGLSHGFMYYEPHSVIQTTDGGYIITGELSQPNHYDVFLMKTDSDGNVEWNRTFGGSNNDHGWSVQQTSDGGYIISASTESFGAGLTDIYLIKTYPNGSKQWEKTFGDTGHEEGGWDRSVQQTSDGGYITTGTTNSSGTYDMYLIKTYPDGSKQWEKTFGGISSDGGNSVQQTSDGGYIIAGDTFSFGAGDSDVYIIKTNSGGIEHWNKTFGGTLWDWGFSVQQTSDGGYIIVGTTGSFGAGSSDVYLIKIKSDNPCYNGIKDSDETDIDCGGSCPKCADGKNCLSRHDCSSDFCNAIGKCGCIDYDEDNHSDLRCGGDDCNDNNASTINCPVLLVHGYMVINPNGTWYMMEDWLKNDGFDVYEIDLEPGILPANGDIMSYAGKLDNEILTILEKTKASKIDIVAHSMGGLVSRWYSRFGYKNNVRKLIMLGTPNHGSELFYGKYALSILSKFLVKLKMIDKIADFVLGDAGKQMTPYSLFLNMLNHDNPVIFWEEEDILNPALEHYTMAGTNDFWLSTWALFGEDDGLVRVKSVKLNNSDSSYEEYYLTHSQLTKNLTLYNDAKSILVSIGSATKMMMGILGMPPPKLLSKTQEAAYIDENIQSDFKIHNFSISYSNIAASLLSWYEEDAVLSLNLIMPNGTLINKTIESINATYYPANASENDTIEGFVIIKPIEGIWQAKVIFKGGVETNYTFMVLLDTDLIVFISTDKSNYHLNEAINLTVNLTNFGSPVLNSDVKASVKKTNGIIENLTLYDDGTQGDKQANDGSYFNVYQNTDLLGIYEITVIANGTLNNVGYYRQTTIQTEVYEPIDLYLNNADIHFSNDNPNAWEEIQISALIHNKANVDLENITVEFYNDDPRHYGELIGRSLINISADSSKNFSILWNTTQDCRYIFVLINSFNPFLEEDYSNNLANKSINVKPQVLQSFNIPLTQPWNLLSIPLQIENNTVNKIFENINYSKIFIYNGKWLELKDNDKINETNGMWVKTNQNQTLIIEGTEFESVNISLKQGWNLVSYPSLNISSINKTLTNINHTSVLAFINNQWKNYNPKKPNNTLNYFTPGFGYWVYSNEDTTLTIN